MHHTAGDAPYRYYLHAGLTMKLLAKIQTHCTIKRKVFRFNSEWNGMENVAFNSTRFFSISLYLAKTLPFVHLQHGSQQVNMRMGSIEFS